MKYLLLLLLGMLTPKESKRFGGSGLGNAAGGLSPRIVYILVRSIRGFTSSNVYADSVSILRSQHSLKNGV